MLVFPIIPFCLSLSISVLISLNIYDIKRFSFEKEYELELESYVAKNVVLLSCTLLFSKKSFISLFLTISKVPGVPILKGVLL